MMHSSSREEKDTVHTALLLTSPCSSNGVGFEGSQLSCSLSQNEELHWWPLEGGLGI